MTSLARVLANRMNAKKSTGPRTQEGKRRSAMNALKHGMTAEITLMPDEDPAAFERRVREWVRDFGPKSDEECFYAERAAYLSWQVQRNYRAQSARLTRRATDRPSSEAEAAGAQGERAGDATVPDADWEPERER